MNFWWNFTYQLLNTHFLPYHNGGHHYNVATPNDAATARKNEILYFFGFDLIFKVIYKLGK